MMPCAFTAITAVPDFRELNRAVNHLSLSMNGNNNIIYAEPSTINLC